MLEILLIISFLALLGVIVMVKPEIATVVVVFLIYTNLPAVLKQTGGLPEALAGAFILLLVFPLVYYLFVKRENLQVDYIWLMMLGFLLVVSLSALFAIDTDLSLKWIVNYSIEGILLYFLVLNVVRNRTNLKQVIWSLIFACTLLGTLSLVQDVTGTYRNDYMGLAQRKKELSDEDMSKDLGRKSRGDKVRTRDRAGGSIGDSNRYAQNMLMILPFALLFMWNEKKRFRKIAALAASALILSGILLSYSRGAFITMLLLFLLLVIMRYIKLYQAALILPVAVVFMLIAAPGYFNRVGTILGAAGLFSQSGHSQADAVTRGRTTEMLAALLCFFDHPFLGVGPAQYTPYYSREYQMDPDIAFRNISRQRRAHILYFEMAAETGILGIGIFMAIVFAMMIRLREVRKRGLARGDTEMANIAAALMLAIIAYMGTAVFLHMSYMRFFWLIMAISGAAVLIFQAELEEDEKSSEQNIGQPDAPKLSIENMEFPKSNH